MEKEIHQIRHCGPEITQPCARCGKIMRMAVINPEEICPRCRQEKRKADLDNLIRGSIVK